MEKDVLKAIKMLECNVEKYCCLIETLKYEEVNLIFKGEGFLIVPKVASIPMLYAENEKDAEAVVNELTGQRVLFTPCKAVADALASVGYTCKGDKQITYYDLGEVLLPDGVEIKELEGTNENIDFITDNYSLHYSKKDVEKLFKTRFMLGLYDNGKLAGFIGMHEERSIGLLEVLPDYRKKGYGTMLIKACVKEFNKKGYYPFCHIIPENYKSIALHEKLNCKTYEEVVFWCFKH